MNDPNPTPTSNPNLNHNPNPIYLKISHANILRQYARHRFLLPDFYESGVQQLKQELDRAVVVADHRFPPDAVGLGSVVEIEFFDPPETVTYKLVLPHEVKGQSGHLSVMTPLGLALLGTTTGQIVHWQLPNERGTLSFRVLKVHPESREATEAHPSLQLQA